MELMTTITTRDEALAFWAEYEKMRATLQLSDTEMEHAFHVNPKRASAFEYEFWTKTYTPEIHKALAIFNQQYES